MEYFEINLIVLFVVLKVGELMCETCSVGSSSKQCDSGCCDADKIEDVCCSAPFWTWYTIIGISLAVIVGISFICFIGYVLCALYKKQKSRAATIRRTISNRSNRVGSFDPTAQTNLQPPPYSERDRHYRTQMTNSPPPPYDYRDVFPNGGKRERANASHGSNSTDFWSH